MLEKFAIPRVPFTPAYPSQIFMWAEWMFASQNTVPMKRVTALRNAALQQRFEAKVAEYEQTAPPNDLVSMCQGHDAELHELQKHTSRFPHISQKYPKSHVALLFHVMEDLKERVMVDDGFHMHLHSARCEIGAGLLFTGNATLAAVDCANRQKAHAPGQAGNSCVVVCWVALGSVHVVPMGTPDSHGVTTTTKYGFLPGGAKFGDYAISSCPELCHPLMLVELDFPPTAAAAAAAAAPHQ